MKKYLCSFLVVIIVICFSQYSQCNEEIKIRINGYLLETEVKPIIINGRTLVPLRATLEALYFNVNWDDVNRIAEISDKAGNIMIVKIDCNVAVVNGKDVTLDVPPKIVSNNTMVPIRFISENFGLTVTWNNNTKEITIDSPSLYPIRIDNKWGFIDEDGKIVIPMQFSDLADISWAGYKYWPYAAYAFSEGLAAVKVGDKWGFINHNGDIVIEPQFVSVDEGFHENYARVEINEGKYSYINRKGEFITKYTFEQSYNNTLFINGFAIVPAIDKDPQNYLDNYINNYLKSNGKLLLSKKGYNPANPFSDGLAAVGWNDASGGYHAGYINTEGKLVITGTFKMNESFSEGLAAIGYGWDPYSTYGFIDKTGKLVIQPKYRNAKPFSEGFAMVKSIDTELWGFINKKGELICGFKFPGKSVLSFYNGFALVQDGSNWRYIDKKGNYISEESFDSSNYFYDGVAAVKVDGKWGYINTNGDYLITPQFDYAEDFHNGLARVYTYIDGRKFYSGAPFKYINTKGDIIWDSIITLKSNSWSNNYYIDDYIIKDDMPYIQILAAFDKIYATKSTHLDTGTVHYVFEDINLELRGNELYQWKYNSSSKLECDILQLDDKYYINFTDFMNIYGEYIECENVTSVLNQ